MELLKLLYAGEGLFDKLLMLRTLRVEGTMVDGTVDVATLCCQRLCVGRHVAVGKAFVDVVDGLSSS